MNRLVFSKEKGRLLANEEVAQLDEDRLIEATEHRMIHGTTPATSADFDGSPSVFPQSGSLIFKDGKLVPWEETAYGISYGIVTTADLVVQLQEK